MESLKHQFHVLDIVSFASMLIFSAAIGVFFAYRDKKKQSTDNYYYGGHDVSPIPVGISFAVSYISAITIIGVPVEIYLYGAVFEANLLSWFLACFMACVYYIPLIHRLKLKTIYEYVELRFHPVLRKAICIMAMLQWIMYMAVTIYLPSLALSAVTPLDLKWTIAVTTAICTFYTTVGGLKAVIWTDVLQSAVMFFGSLAVFITTLNAVGGFNEVMKATERGKRNNFFNFDFDPRIRSTFWTIFLAHSVEWCSITFCTQISSQRYLSCKSIRHARLAVLVAICLPPIYGLLALGNGLSMYAYYEDCDPFLSEQISKVDQTVPYMAVDVLQSMPGVAGLFVSAAYSGTLSTVSSGVNSLAALTVMDFVLPKWPALSSKKRMLLSKILSLLYGIFVMMIAYIISTLESNSLEICAKLTGFSFGPIVAVFTMGVFMPWVNYKGASIGFFSGFAITAWIALSSIFVEPLKGAHDRLPLSVEGCNLTATMTQYINMTLMHNVLSNSTDGTDDTNQRPLIYDTLYSLSPYLFGVLGFVVCLVVGNVGSFATGIDKPSAANPDLFLPLLDNKLLPWKVRKFFRFGVPERCPKKTATSAEKEMIPCQQETEEYPEENSTLVMSKKQNDEEFLPTCQ